MDAGKIKAEREKGVLAIHLPKKAGGKAKGNRDYRQVEANLFRKDSVQTMRLAPFLEDPCSLSIEHKDKEGRTGAFPVPSNT